MIRYKLSHLYLTLISRRHINFSHIFHDSDYSFSENKLNFDQVEEIINTKAVCEVLKSNLVSHFYSNQVGVNRPVEDRWNVGCLDLTNFKASDVNTQTLLGHFFAVVDGHNGHACSHTVNYCHMDYVSVLMINDVNILKGFLEHLNYNKFMNLTRSMVSHNTWGTMATSVRESHFRNIKEFISETIFNFDANISRELALSNGLSRLDKDMISAAIPRNDLINRALLRTVSSGCVGSFVYVPEDERKIYVAQVGDCGCVLGSLDSVTNTWSADLFMEPHNSSNVNELERIESEHPPNESQNVIRQNRLLGELMPLRAFGDVRFKWPLETLRITASLLNVSPSYSIAPQFYLSPPYLTSHPEIRVIDFNEKSYQFLILASDGLWDLISPSEAVHAIGTWWQDQAVLNENNSSSILNGFNASSLLIKTALGGATMDYDKLSRLLSMPANVGRYYRDDITVIVVFFKA